MAEQSISLAQMLNVTCNGLTVQQSCTDDEHKEILRILTSLMHGERPTIALESKSHKDAVLLRELQILVDSCNISDGRLNVSEANLPKCGLDLQPLVGKFSGSPVEWLNVLVNALVRKTVFSTVVVAVKDEGPWLLEWIAHYKAIGIARIIVYYNNCTDGSDQLLQYLAHAGEIVAIPNFVADGVSPQKQAFAHALSVLRLTHSAEWIAFIDADEYLVGTASGQDFAGMIEDVRAAAGGGKINCIAANWNWFADPGQFDWVPGLVTARFRSSVAHSMKKCLFMPEFALSILDIHYPMLTDQAVRVDASGELLEDLKPDVPVKGTPRVRLNHYFAKSFEEFCLKRWRGRGACAAGTETRQFSAFMWGAKNVSPSPADLAWHAAISYEIERLMAIPGITASSHNIDIRVRSKLQAIQAEVDLRKVYRAVLQGDQTA